MKAIYAGSFDPISNGHLDIIKRAAKLYDELHIVDSNNILKKYTFTVEERIDMLRLATVGIKNVIITAYDGLVVNYAKENKIRILIRGMRNYSDYENEFNLYQYNKDLAPEIETLIMMPSTKNLFISSSAIKELVTFNCDISKYIPKIVNDIVVNKIKKGH